MSYTHEIYSVENTTEKSKQEFLADLFGMQWDSENSVASYGTMLEKDRCGINISSDSAPKLIVTYAGANPGSSLAFTLSNTYKYLHKITTDKFELYGVSVAEKAIDRFIFAKCKIADIIDTSNKKDCILFFVSSSNYLYITGEDNSLTGSCNYLASGLSPGNAKNSNGKIVLTNLLHIKDGTTQLIDGVYACISTPYSSGESLRTIFSLNGKEYYAIREYGSSAMPIVAFEL